MRTKLNKRGTVILLLNLLAIPLAILFGVFFLNDRQFYFISVTVLILAMMPFFLLFEQRKPQAKELIVIAVMCAIGVAGRVAFFMLPQVKPILAIIIISGIIFGKESGFLVGTMSAFVSNFFFGQGPWTPWQMFCMGLIGMLAGILFKEGRLPRKIMPICIYGGLATLIIYGAIINLGSTLMWSQDFNWQILLSFYLTGLPFDLVHAGSTVLFLFILAPTMIEKLERIQLKYGLIESE